MTKEQAAPEEEKKPGKPKQTRNRIKTELKILYTLEEILTKKGFDGLKINAIAQEAGVSKELIYRYFGGLDGLLSSWMDERDYWSLRQIDAAHEGRADQSAGTAQLVDESLAAYLKDLRAKPQIQEIRRWEVASNNPISRQIARRREEAGKRLVSRFPDDTREDAAAIYSILQAGLCYLVLRSNVLDTYCGVPLNTEEGWQRIESAMHRMIETVFAADDKAET